MEQTEHHAEAYKGQTLHRRVLCLLKGAISVYAAAMIASIFLSTEPMTVFHHFLSDGGARVASALYLAATIALLLLSVSLGPTAILLALYIFASRPMELPAFATPEETQALIRDISLIALLYVFAIFASVSTQRAPSWRHRQIVAPRRVRPTKTTARSKRPEPDEPVLTREKILSGQVFPPIHAGSAKLTPEDSNLFATVFDAQEDQLQRV